MWGARGQFLPATTMVVAVVMPVVFYAMDMQRWENVKLASNSVLELDQFLPTQAHLT
jgi:hypothetical protein